MSEFETDLENRFFKGDIPSMTSLPSSNQSKEVNSATSSPKLWSKVKTSPYLKDLTNYTIMPSSAYKKSSPSASAKRREFFLKDSFLFYTESSTKGKLRGKLDLNFSYVQI